MAQLILRTLITVLLAGSQLPLLAQDRSVAVLEQNGQIHGFDYYISGKNLRTINWGTGTGNYLWEFGDGQTSTERSPDHTYVRGGIYTLSLTIREESENIVISKDIEIFVSEDAKDLGKSLKMYPNPVRSELHLDFSEYQYEKLEIVIRDITGNAVKEFNLLADPFNTDHTVEMDALPNGVYLVEIMDPTHGRNLTKRLVKN